tara:strand:+ start:882 stop:1178 length:297 start_codon:yes stop_codon:yes gene_type:complete
MAFNAVPCVDIMEMVFQQVKQVRLDTAQQDWVDEYNYRQTTALSTCRQLRSQSAQLIDDLVNQVGSDNHWTMDIGAVYVMREIWMDLEEGLDVADIEW